MDMHSDKTPVDQVSGALALAIALLAETAAEHPRSTTIAFLTKLATEIDQREGEVVTQATLLAVHAELSKKLLR